MALWQGVPDEMLEGVSKVLGTTDALCRHGRLLQIVVQAVAIVFVEDCPYRLAMIGAHTQDEPVVPGGVVRAVVIARARGRTVLMNRARDVRFSGQAPAGVGIPYFENAIFV